MTDEEIISLYFDRNEEAIQETQRKYDGYCRSVITRILGNPRDAEETLSDVWLKAWLSIPPAHPTELKLYLARIGRNLALNRLRDGRAARRGDRADAVLEELGRSWAETAPRKQWMPTSCERPSTASCAGFPNGTVTFSCGAASMLSPPRRSPAAMACAPIPSLYPCTAPAGSCGNT